MKSIYISKYKVLLPLALVSLADFGFYCLCPLVLLLPNTFRLLGFPIFWFCTYLMKVIPNTLVSTNFDIYGVFS